MEAAAAELRDPLRAGPLRRAEVERLHGRERALGVGHWLELVRVPPSGTWSRRRADLYAAAEDWIGRPAADARRGLDRLVTRYLSGFGPAPRDDIANWAGLPAGAIDAALGRLDLRRLREERGGELFDLPRAPLPDADAPAPVRFLPTWDATLLVHARRTGILPEQHRPKIFHTRIPQSKPTFLVDGEVAGTWRWSGDRVEVDPFARLDPAAARAVAAEAERVAEPHR